MTQYRYTGTSLYRSGDRITKGDTITPTEAELESFGDCLEPVDEDGGPYEYELCATEMSDGELCDRVAAECPYHD